MSPAKENAVIPDQDHFKKRHVLVEYDGPRIALWTSTKKDLRLGTFVGSDDDNADRWLVANVTRAEVEALARAMVPALEAFEKQGMAIVDFKRGKAVRAWKADDPSVFEEALPVEDAYLPQGAREFLLEKVVGKRPVSGAARSVRFDGRRIKGSMIELSAFSRITGTLQDFWTALAETLGVMTVKGRIEYAPSALIADARLGRGSIAVALHPTDEQVFDSILAKYRDIMGAGYGDAASLGSAIQSDDVRQKMTNYLAVLSALEVDAFFEAPSARVYTGHSRARVVHAALKLLGKGQSEPADDDVRVATTVTKKGYFDGVEISRDRFDFVDIESGEMLSGTLGPGLADRLRSKPVQVGGSAMLYKAVFSVDQESKALMSFEVLQTDLFGE